VHNTLILKKTLAATVGPECDIPRQQLIDADDEVAEICPGIEAIELGVVMGAAPVPERDARGLR
jgi:hypothetical protein